MTNNAENLTSQTADTAPQGAPVAPQKPAPDQGSTPKKADPKGQKNGKVAVPATPFDNIEPQPKGKSGKPKANHKPVRTKKPAKGESKAQAAAQRRNKKAEVIAMMKRAKGATLPEIIKTTGWQPHTVRGFVSILGSRHGLKIESSKNPANERTYKIAH